MSYSVTANKIPKLTLGESYTAASVLQGVALILSTMQGTCPLYRNFGINRRSIDKPVDVAKPMLVIDLDILAYDFKVDWWDPNYTAGQKRAIFKQNWAVHKKLGTRYAVETALNAIYPGTTIEEWFEYDGEPYHFRVMLDITQAGQLNSEQIRRAIMYYTRLTAVLDEVMYQFSATAANMNTFYFDFTTAWYRIMNSTATSDYVKLDGSQMLDGTWKLRSKQKLPAFCEFAIDGFAMRHNESVTGPTIQMSVSVENRNSLYFDSIAALNQAAIKEPVARDYIKLDGSRTLDGTWELRNRQSLPVLREISASGYSARHKENVTGSITLDNRWTLNGAVQLDGSRKFSYLIEEEI